VWNVPHSVHLNVSKTMIITANLHVACVTSEREREKRVAQDTVSVVATLPLYALKVTTLEDFYYLHTCFRIKEAGFLNP
jgi:hypothetical protein